MERCVPLSRVAETRIDMLPEDCQRKTASKEYCETLTVTQTLQRPTRQLRWHCHPWHSIHLLHMLNRRSCCSRPAVTFGSAAAPCSVQTYWCCWFVSERTVQLRSLSASKPTCRNFSHIFSKLFEQVAGELCARTLDKGGKQRMLPRNR